MKKLFNALITIIVLFTIFLLIQPNLTQSFQNKGADNKELYKNEISLSELKKEIENNRNATIYFYQTNCSHCKVVSPIIIPMAESLNIDLKTIDLEEYPDAWDAFQIEATPTIVNYNNKKEVDRIEGEYPKSTFEEWLEATK